MSNIKHNMFTSNNYKSKKSQIWVSAVLYTMVAAVSIAFIVQAGLPLVEGMRDRSTFNRMKNQMMVLDQYIEQVASEGRGSQRYVPFEIAQGDFRIDNNGVRWEMQTSARIVEPRSSYKIGNIMISANSDVTARDRGDYYLLENSRISAKLYKNGTSDNYVNISTNNLIHELSIAGKNVTVNPTFSFMIGDDENSQHGVGYTYLSRQGSFLGSASYVAYIETEDYSYELHIILEGETDFFKTEVKNFRRH